jgi:hypothetical protein
MKNELRNMEKEEVEEMNGKKKEKRKSCKDAKLQGQRGRASQNRLWIFLSFVSLFCRSFFGGGGGGPWPPSLPPSLPPSK